MNLQIILKKLKVNSIEEFMERERQLDKKYKDCETERHPFSNLTNEELHFFRDCVNQLYFKKSII